MPEPSVRLDLWLHAARFFKTRALAAAAVDAGRVELNGERTKRSKPLQPGALLRIRAGAQEWSVVVLALSARRGPASAAAALYRETPESREARARSAEQHRLAAQWSVATKGRPTKRDRRKLDRFKEL